jgi:hypothetical protein
VYSGSGGSSTVATVACGPNFARTGVSHHTRSSVPAENRLDTSAGFTFTFWMRDGRDSSRPAAAGPGPAISTTNWPKPMNELRSEHTFPANSPWPVVQSMLHWRSAATPEDSPGQAAQLEPLAQKNCTEPSPLRSHVLKTCGKRTLRTFTSADSRLSILMLL